MNFRAGNMIEEEENPFSRSIWLFEGFYLFLEMVERLQDIRIDFEETWIKYTNRDEIYNVTHCGLFTPYDPNINLLEGASQKFYQIFQEAAQSSLFQIDKQINKPHSILLLHEVFGNASQSDRALNLGKMDFLTSQHPQRLKLQNQKPRV